MQPLFPTKKFFIVLAFLALSGVGAFKLFWSFDKKPAESPAVAVTEKTDTRPYANIVASEIKGEPVLATSTMQAVATVAYLKEQTKANGATLEEIAGSAGKKIQAEKKRLDSDTYTAKDLTVREDNSPEALKKYGKITAGIFFYYGNEQQKSSYIEIIKKALEKNDTKELAKLDPFIDFYKKVLGASLAVPVPSSAVSVHLQIVNSYAETLAVLENFRNLFGNLFPAVASHSRLDESSKRFIVAFTEADAFFKQKGITFLPEESGSLFATVAAKNKGF